MAMNCRGCGTELDPGQQQVDSAVDQILQTSLKDSQAAGGVCPLCGHYKIDPNSRHKKIFYGILKALLLVATAIEIVFYISRTTERSGAANEALRYMNANSTLVQFLGKPIKMKSGLAGEVRHDETGWKEARLTIPVQGPKAEAMAYVVGGKGTGPWTFSSFEVLIEAQHKKIDIISGSVVEYDSTAYLKLHTQAALPPVYNNASVPPPSLDGEFPCVFASLDGSQSVPQFGKCPMPTSDAGAVDRIEADLRYGDFVLRQTDLEVNDVFDVQLTRSYRSRDWVSSSALHAFGLNTNHPFDIAPVGTRNPYTYMLIGLENGDFLYFDRISKGTGYADAVYRHTETSTRFYKSVIGWNGDGWTLRLADGSEIRFPESYSAKNSAQGAPTAMLDAGGNLLDFRRDPQRNLQAIKTPHGHSIKFSYDELFRIVGAEDDEGKSTRYAYNPDNMLTDVISSSGRERHYSYQGTLMTQITDERKNVLLRNWYDHSLLIRQQFGNGESYSYQYEWLQNAYCPAKVVVTLPHYTTKEIRGCDSVPNFVRNFHH